MVRWSDEVASEILWWNDPRKKTTAFGLFESTSSLSVVASRCLVRQSSGGLIAEREWRRKMYECRRTKKEGTEKDAMIRKFHHDGPYTYKDHHEFHDSSVIPTHLPWMLRFDQEHTPFAVLSPNPL
ncbi:unnamed protein product [Lactuca virosa]|uniref:Uncharacterized protein n=1 Tax=Lactuca virosa TaxID=75947 RepID=A0AAU9PS28_9ASTR|nr:unnamed protein product [Lactuca virosa]